MPRPLAPPLAAVAVAVAVTLTAAATTAPTTRPAAGRDSVVGRWFDQLADPDPAVRDRAREDLMGLPADRLPDLLAVVRAAAAAAPVRPAQGAVLHDVVTQVFLTGEHYDAVGDADDPQRLLVPQPERAYVVGIRWPIDLVDAPARLGVPVVERWPGFPARRMLRDGDLILGVFVNPDEPIDHLPNRQTTTTPMLREAILAATGPGTDHRVVLLVLRDGRERRVAITLVPQPVEAAGRALMSGDDFVQRRQRQADAYWDQSFAPLVVSDDEIGPTPPADAASLDGPP